VNYQRVFSEFTEWIYVDKSFWIYLHYLFFFITKHLEHFLCLYCDLVPGFARLTLFPIMSRLLPYSATHPLLNASRRYKNAYPNANQMQPKEFRIQASGKINNSVFPFWSFLIVREINVLNDSLDCCSRFAFHKARP